MSDAHALSIAYLVNQAVTGMRIQCGNSTKLTLPFEIDEEKWEKLEEGR